MESAQQTDAFVDHGSALVGGKYSKGTTLNCGNVTALAHRDAGFMVLHYVHYENVVDEKDTDEWKKVALLNTAKWSAGVDKNFNGDKRWNMFPYQAGPKNADEPTSPTNPNQIDRNLDKLKDHYFDNDDVYKRVLNTKRLVDPNDVFTPNLFCVGASRKYPGDSEGWDSEC